MKEVFSPVLPDSPYPSLRFVPGSGTALRRARPISPHFDLFNWHVITPTSTSQRRCV